MDEIHSLQCRIVELETELRLVKQQLAQDQRGVLYLVSCLGRGKFATARQDEDARVPHFLSQAQTTLDSGLTSSLTSRLNSTAGYASPPRLNYANRSHFKPSNLAFSAESLERKVNNSTEKDLLTFDDEITSPSANIQSQATTPLTRPSASGVSFIDSVLKSPLTSFSPEDVPGESLSIFQSQSTGLGISYPDQEEDVFAGPRDFGEWNRCHSPIPPEPDLIFEKRFLDSEHNRLLGYAVYIEDMSQAERVMFWEECAQENGRHPPQEWEIYYERVVKPTYLANVALRAQNVEVEKAIDADELIEKAMPVEEEPKDVVLEQGLRSSMWCPSAQQTTLPIRSRVSNDFASITPPTTPTRPTSFRGPNYPSDLFFNYESTDPSLFRSVLISNIPVGVSFADVLDHVDMATTASATFAQTAGMKTTPPMEGNSVLVVFSTADDAGAFVERCRDTPIVLAVDDEMVTVGVEIVKTPSRPLRLMSRG